MADRVFPIPFDRSAYGDSIVQKWDVQIQESASGMFRALTEQDFPRYEYTLKFPHLTVEQKNDLIGFYALCKGQLLPFYIKMDGHMEKQVLGRGSDGAYQLIKGFGEYVEPIHKADNLEVFSDGVVITNYTVVDGKLSTVANGTISASYDYYEYVRFGNELSVNQIFDNLYSVSVKLVTAR